MAASIHLRLTRRQMASFNEAARTARLPLRTWLRTAGNWAVRESIERARGTGRAKREEAERSATAPNAPQSSDRRGPARP